jgi:hypothetical protein
MIVKCVVAHNEFPKSFAPAMLSPDGIGRVVILNILSQKALQGSETCQLKLWLEGKDGIFNPNHFKTKSKSN